MSEVAARTSQKRCCEAHKTELDDYGVCVDCEELIQVFLRQHLLDPAAGLVALQIARYEKTIAELERTAEKLEEVAEIQRDRAVVARKRMLTFTSASRDPLPIMQNVDEYAAHLLTSDSANFGVISHALRSQIEASLT